MSNDSNKKDIGIVLEQEPAMIHDENMLWDLDFFNETLKPIFSFNL